MILTAPHRRLHITKILPVVLVFYASVYLLWPVIQTSYRDTNWSFISRDVLSDDKLSHTQNETLGVRTL